MSQRIVWELEHSVDAEVTPEFAWKYRTDVANWNDPPAKFVLNGPFIPGSCGTTLLPEQEALHWIVKEVRPPDSFVLEMQFERAVLTFEWSFRALSEHSTRMTQKIVLFGDNAETYLPQVEASLRSGLADGMSRIATEMVAAEQGSRAAG